MLIHSEYSGNIRGIGDIPVASRLIMYTQAGIEAVTFGGSGNLCPVECLQSHFILTMSHWSSGLPVCVLSQGTRVQNPRGYLCETGISPVSIVSPHW
jgi:hypothetical protein